MSRAMADVPLKETNNQKQGKTGAGTPTHEGTVKITHSNPTKGGGIFRPLKKNS